MIENKEIKTLDSDAIIKNFDERTEEQQKYEAEHPEPPQDTPEQTKFKLDQLHKTIRKIRANIQGQKNRIKKLSAKKRARRLMAKKSRKRNKT